MSSSSTSSISPFEVRIIASSEEAGPQLQCAHLQPGQVAELETLFQEQYLPEDLRTSFPRSNRAAAVFIRGRSYAVLRENFRRIVAASNRIFRSYANRESLELRAIERAALDGLRDLSGLDVEISSSLEGRVIYIHSSSRGTHLTLRGFPAEEQGYIYRTLQEAWALIPQREMRRRTPQEVILRLPDHWQANDGVGRLRQIALYCAERFIDINASQGRPRVGQLLEDARALAHSSGFTLRVRDAAPERERPSGQLPANVTMGFNPSGNCFEGRIFLFGTNGLTRAEVSPWAERIQELLLYFWREFNQAVRISGAPLQIFAHFERLLQDCRRDCEGIYTLEEVIGRAQANAQRLGLTLRFEGRLRRRRQGLPAAVPEARNRPRRRARNALENLLDVDPDPALVTAPRRRPRRPARDALEGFLGVDPNPEFVAPRSRPRRRANRSDVDPDPASVATAPEASLRIDPSLAIPAPRADEGAAESEREGTIPFEELIALFCEEDPDLSRS